MCVLLFVFLVPPTKILNIHVASGLPIFFNQSHNYKFEKCHLKDLFRPRLSQAGSARGVLFGFCYQGKRQIFALRPSLEPGVGAARLNVCGAYGRPWPRRPFSASLLSPGLCSAKQEAYGIAIALLREGSMLTCVSKITLRVTWHPLQGLRLC